MPKTLPHTFNQVITKSSSMIELLSFLSRVAPTDASILILGETGTGKELIARAIHSASHRSNAPLVVINCAAIPENLLESELFGYKKGAFTDAREDKKGKIEEGDGGTIFLDEVAELSFSAQAKILRIIEDHQLERLGDNRLYPVDVRVIAATNVDLEKELRRGGFRADLYYRLNEVKVVIPPLRERKEDIPLLIEHFIQQFNPIFHKKVKKVSNTVLCFLMRYHFPGNVRELRSLIKRAMIVVERDVIWLEDLPIDIRVHSEPSEGVEPGYLLTLKEWLEKIPIGVPLEPSKDVAPAISVEAGSGQRSDNENKQKEILSLKENEKIKIKEALRKCGNNKTKAAKLLGINRSTLHQKIKLYGIEA